MEVAEDLRVPLGDALTAAQQEASAARAVLLQGPAIGAVVSVLGQAVGHQDCRQEKYLFHPEEIKILCAFNNHQSCFYRKDFRVKKGQKITSFK